MGLKSYAHQSLLTASDTEMLLCEKGSRLENTHVKAITNM